ncbi:hypothetical protein ACFWPX_29965 [Nocardia sp. NPDC058518]|uniref:hypothetical protein n=1 Tax=Nocardia sp. NPDC058518 TaxID=3346534 RepID=UPI00364893B0
MKDTKDTKAATGIRAAGQWLIGSKTTFWLAFGFFGFAILAGAGVLFARFTSGDDAAAAGTTSSAAAPTTSAPAGGGFGTPSADTLGRPVEHPRNPAGQPLAQTPAAPTDYQCELPPNCPAAEVPQGLMWQEVKPWVLPFSTSAGPARVEGPLAFGFQRSPQGAALAAWQIAWRAASSRENFDLFLARQAAGEPQDFESMKATKDWDYSDRVSAAKRPSAFRITGWQPSGFAVIQFAVPSTPGTWSVIALNVVWQDGDWKLRAPGGSTQHSQTLVSLAGWTQW